jgi:WD40 repeat protein
MLATASVHGAVKLWDTTSDTGRVRTLEMAHAGAAVRGIAFNGANVLASVGDDGSCKLWDTRTGAETLALKAEGDGSGQQPQPRRAVAFSPDGSQLWIGGWDCNVSVYGLQGPSKANKIANLSGVHRDWVEAIAFAPSGKLAATGGRDGTVRVWEYCAGRQPVRGAELEAEGAPWICSLSLGAGPDGKTLVAAGCWDSTVHVWDAKSGNLVATLGTPAPKNSRKQITAVQFAPNGRHLMTACADQVLRLWDVTKPAAPLLEFVASAPATAVAISSRAQLIAAGDTIGTVYLLKYFRRSSSS